jgi:tRNA (guanine-N7-)-methyltransferase
MARIPLRETAAGAEFIGVQVPPDWAGVFARLAPTTPVERAPLELELEIGCGAGGFALEYCRRNPRVGYVAFEWRKKYAREVQFRAEKQGLANLRVIEGDARIEVPLLFPEACLSAIHLQFPDPWWKRAHHKRAILQPDFTAFLLTRLRPGGRFDFRTDVEERARQGLAILEGAGFANPLGAGAFHPVDPEEVPSTRERRYLITGEPVFRARLVRPP